MFLGCVNDLTPEKLAVCIPPEEQQIAFMVFPTIDNIVCSRVKRKAFSFGFFLLFEILIEIVLLIRRLPYGRRKAAKILRNILI